jgi:eukaryotic-like serine/threonine-protein kinase
VLLFYLLMNHHPLEGAREAAIHCFDLPAMTKLYGTEPIFIYDPIDDRNRPVAGYHDNALAFWPIYPEFLRKLFTRAFTDGLRDPAHGRVRESEWRAALVQLRDSLCYCPNCKAENFYDAESARNSGQTHAGTCWACQQPVRLPPRIRIAHSGSHSGTQSGNQQIVVLRHDSKLYPHHINRNRLYDFSKPIAEIAFHPTNPSVWGLKNLADDKWVATTASGEVRDVPPGRTVTIATGTRVQFGASEGILRL